MAAVGRCAASQCAASPARCAASRSRVWPRPSASVRACACRPSVHHSDLLHNFRTQICRHQAVTLRNPRQNCHTLYIYIGRISCNYLEHI